MNIKWFTSWRETVINHYGSVAQFRDLYTVETFLARLKTEVQQETDFRFTLPPKILAKWLFQTRKDFKNAALYIEELEEWMRNYSPPC